MTRHILAFSIVVFTACGPSGDPGQEDDGASTEGSSSGSEATVSEATDDGPTTDGADDDGTEETGPPPCLPEDCSEDAVCTNVGCRPISETSFQVGVQLANYCTRNLIRVRLQIDANWVDASEFHNACEPEIPASELLLEHAEHPFEGHRLRLDDGVDVLLWDLVF